MYTSERSDAISSSKINTYANFSYVVCFQTSIMSFDEDNFLRLKVVEYFARDMTGKKKFGFNYEKKNNKKEFKQLSIR